MPSLFINLDIKDIELNSYSSYKKYEDSPVKRGKIIVISGSPVYSSTYAFPEVIDFNSGGKRIKLPEIFSIRIEQASETENNIGTLNYIEEFSDDELGFDEPTQFEAIVLYPEKEFSDIWEFIGKFNIGNISVSCAIDAPETDASGYTAIIDVEKSNSWLLRTFSLRRREERT